MNKMPVIDEELSGWVSTYGLITIERIFERYQLPIASEDLITALKNHKSFFNQLLAVPLKNIFNGIIMEQAKDYQTYVQKLFVDYLISGEPTRSEESPGSSVRAELEEDRQELVKKYDDFHEQVLAHTQLIAETQHLLIEFIKKWRSQLANSSQLLIREMQDKGLKVKDEEAISRCLIALLANEGIDSDATLSKVWERIEKRLDQTLDSSMRSIFTNKLSDLNHFDEQTQSTAHDLYERAVVMNTALKKFRSDFSADIPRINQKLKSLPEYRTDVEQIQKNREGLEFDPHIGGDPESS